MANGWRLGLAAAIATALGLGTAQAESGVKAG